MKIKVSDVLAKYIGVAGKVIQLIFEIAEANKPTIIFIDEIDSLIADRNPEGGKQSNSGSGTVTAMLEECQRRDGIFMIACTNLPWSVLLIYV